MLVSRIADRNVSTKMFQIYVGSIEKENLQRNVTRNIAPLWTVSYLRIAIQDAEKAMQNRYGCDTKGSTTAAVTPRRVIEDFGVVSRPCRRKLRGRLARCSRARGFSGAEKHFPTFPEGRDGEAVRERGD